MRAVIAAIALLVLSAGIASAQSEAAEDFTLKPGDVLEVTVLEDANLNRSVLVRPDGRITLPIVGSVEAGGRTPEQLRGVIVSRLSRDFVTPPTVSVALSALGARNQLDEQERIEGEFGELPGQVFVVGQVGRPGGYEFDVEKPISILQAISLAGGPGPFAATKRIQIRRAGDTGEQVFLYNYRDVEKGDPAQRPIILEDGDVIVVPERGLFE
ncbi:MAG: polysaccharide biosynthesis/export family protein [Pseudomonadota bacterium]